MKCLSAFLKWCWICKTIILVLFQLGGISFFAYANTFKDVSIPVRSDTIDVEIILHKEGLSDKIAITSDDPVLGFLKDKEEEIEKLNKDLVEAEANNKSKEEINVLEKELEAAENRFRTSLSLYGKDNIKVKLQAGYQGPIFLKKNNKCNKVPPFYFYAEGGREEKIHVCELKNLIEDIEVQLNTKGKNIEVIKESDSYKLNFDKAKDIVGKFKGKLKGKADLKFGISPQADNPITFSETQAPKGGSFKIKIPTDNIDKDDHLLVYFIKDSKPAFPSTIPSGKKQKQEDTFYMRTPFIYSKRLSQVL